MSNRNDANYVDAIERLRVYRQQVAVDINANSFVSNMTIFMRSVEYGATVDRLEAHYNKVKTYYEAGVTVPSEIQGTDSTGYSNLVKALANYLGSDTQSSAEELIAIARKDENSVRFINIINLIKVKSTGSWQGDVDANNEVEDLWFNGYNAAAYCVRNERLAKIVNYLNTGFAGESFAGIANYLLSGHGVADPYMCLADFESYYLTHKRAIDDYRNRTEWSRKSLHNIAASGFFAADRSIREYADRIWGLQDVKIAPKTTKKTKTK
jgi:hypothetical protein